MKQKNIGIQIIDNKLNNYMKKILLLCMLLFATFYFAQIKTKLILNDGSVENGYIFEMESDDLKLFPKDLFKIRLYSDKKKKKSTYKSYSRNEITNLYIYNKKNQEVSMVFVKPSLQEFNETKKNFSKLDKKIVLNYDEVWTPMILVKSGKDADLLCSFTYEDSFKLAIQGNYYVSDSYTFYVVKKKNEDIATLLGVDSKTSGLEIKIGSDKDLERNSKNIFKALCPQLVKDIDSKTFKVKYNPVKVFDYYLEKCN